MVLPNFSHCRDIGKVVIFSLILMEYGTYGVNNRTQRGMSGCLPM